MGLPEETACICLEGQDKYGLCADEDSGDEELARGRRIQAFLSDSRLVSDPRERLSEALEGCASARSERATKVRIRWRSQGTSAKSGFVGGTMDGGGWLLAGQWQRA